MNLVVIETKFSIQIFNCCYFLTYCLNNNDNMDNAMTQEEERFINNYEPSSDIVEYFKDSEDFKHRKKRNYIYVTMDHQKYTGEKVLLTPYLTLTQRNAAMLLYMKQASLSKLWKKISNGKPWPHLSIRKTDRKITHQKLLLMSFDKYPEKYNQITSVLENLYKERKALLPECYIVRVHQKWYDPHG